MSLMHFDAPYRQDPNHPLNPPQPGVDRTIPVDLGNGKIEAMPESQLLRHTGESENDNEIVSWVEYHLPEHEGGRLVHRSAHVHLKKATVFGEATAAAIG